MSKSNNKHISEGADAPTIVGGSAKNIIDEVNRSADNSDIASQTVKADSSLTETDDTPTQTEDMPLQSEDAPLQTEDTPLQTEDVSENDIDDFSDNIETNENISSTDDDVEDSIDEDIIPTTHFNMRKLLKIVLICAGSLIVLCLILLFIGNSLTPKDKIAKNVWVGDMNVSELTYDEALLSIQASDLLSKSNIKFKCNDDYYICSGVDIGSSAIPEQTAKLAFDYGKSGNIINDAFTSLSLLFKKHTISPSAELNDEMLTSVLLRFGTDVYGELVQHSVSFNESSAIVTPGHTGFDLNVATAVEEVKTAFSQGIFDPIPVTLKSAPPYDFTVESFDNICYKDPVNAEYSVDGKTVNIVPDVPGRYIDKAEVEQYLPLIKEGGEVITVPLRISTADVTAAMLKEKLFSNTLGSYSTNYGGSTSNRAANVARAASLLNGSVVAPGNVFSFNQAVGPRSTSNGFYTAAEYVNGQSVQGIGGGTCQVSTTLYSAVLYSDLGIVSRTNHMMTIGYAPLGQDATVAYGSVDFKFRNTSDYPIKITATTNGGTISVSIIGTGWNPAREVKVSHSTSYSGGNTVVNSVRKVYSNGELISTDKLGTSVYAPHA